MKHLDGCACKQCVSEKLEITRKMVLMLGDRSEPWHIRAALLEIIDLITDIRRECLNNAGGEE